MGCVVPVLGLFFLFGFALLGYGLWNAKRSTEAASWPTPPAKLTSLKLAETIDSEGSPTFEVKVQYSYTVDGVAFEGSRLAFGYTASGGREVHEEIRGRLESAKAVDVRYDPSDPAVSCLSFGLHRSIQFVLTFAVVWLVFVIGFAALFWVGSSNDAVLVDNLSVR